MREGFHTDIGKNYPLVTADQWWRVSVSGDKHTELG